jgi:hypothetical protein
MRDDLLGAIDIGTIDPSVSMDTVSIETIVKSGAEPASRVLRKGEDFYG